VPFGVQLALWIECRNRTTPDNGSSWPNQRSTQIPPSPTPLPWPWKATGVMAERAFGLGVTDLEAARENRKKGSRRRLRQDSNPCFIISMRATTRESWLKWTLFVRIVRIDCASYQATNRIWLDVARPLHCLLAEMPAPMCKKRRAKPLSIPAEPQSSSPPATNWLAMTPIALFGGGTWKRYRFLMLFHGMRPQPASWL
jgi:hypothetical protein